MALPMYPGLQTALLNLNYPQLASYCSSIIGSNPSLDHLNSINADVLRLIYCEAVPPNVYKIWLAIAVKHEPELLRIALADPFSSHVRAVAIQQLARISRSPDWRSRGWAVLGYAEGIKVLTESLSVEEKASLLLAVSRSLRRPDFDLSVHFDRLVHILRKDAPQWTRYLTEPLVPLCSRGSVQKALVTIEEAEVTSRLLDGIAVRHTGLLRCIATGDVKVPGYLRKAVIQGCVKPMIRSSDPYTPIFYRDTVSLLPGIAFVLDLFCGMARESPDKLQPSRINPYIYESLRHICRRNASFHHIHVLMARTLPFIAIGSDADLAELLVNELLRCWSIAGFKTAAQAKSPTKRLLSPDHPSRPSIGDKDPLEALVIGVIRQCPPCQPWTSHDQSPFKTLETVLQGIAADARLPFLKLLCRHSEALGFDLDHPPQEKEKAALPIWPHGVMKLLPAPDIGRLFDRMLSMHGCQEYLPVHDAVDSPLSSLAQCQLKVRVEADGMVADNPPIATSGISAMKQRAEAGQCPQVTVYWAVQAVETSLLSGSLSLFREVIEWSLRFMQDNAIFPDLMVSSILGPQASEVLGCVVPPRRGRSRHEVQKLADQANATLIRLLAILLDVSAEPIDFARIADSIPPFLDLVLASRIKALRQYEKQGHSSDVLLAWLIEPMIEVVARYDEEGYELDWWDTGIMLSELQFDKLCTPQLIPYVDRLIKKMDKPWDQQGVGESSRQIGLPCGLPVHRLLPPRLAALVLRDPAATPYGAARIHDILFEPASVLMTRIPTLEEPGALVVRDAEVDVLAHVISAYVFARGRRERSARLLEVWSYYASVLTAHPEVWIMVQGWLAGKAKEWGLRKASSTIEPPRLPKLPQWERRPHRSLIVWDPCRDAGPPRVLSAPVSVLLCRVRGDIPSGNILTDRRERVSLGEFWAVDVRNHLSYGTSTTACDGVVLAAMLLLGAMSNQPLLPELFPSAESVRWPVVALDYAFVCLASTNPLKAIDGAIKALEKGIALVPTRLLGLLIMSLLDSIDAGSPSRSIMLHTAVKLAKLFPSSNQPELGVAVVLRLLRYLPDKSVYHQHLRLRDLGRALRPAEAIDFMHSLAGTVRKRIRTPTSPVNTASLKRLARLLATADFVPLDTSLSIMQSIYDSTLAINVHMELQTPALSLLEREPNRAAEVLAFLRQATLSTVEPKREDQMAHWIWDEQAGRLPDIAGFCSRKNLERFAQSAFQKLSDIHRQRYAQDILCPMVTECTELHNQWMRKFLWHFGWSQRCNLDFGTFIPSAVDFVINIWHEYLPSTFLEYSRNIITTYTSSPQFEILNSHIIRSPQFLNPHYSFAIQHWNEVLRHYRQAHPLVLLDTLLSRDLQTRLHCQAGITELAVLAEYRTRMVFIAAHPERYDPATNQRTISTATLLPGLAAMRKHRDRPSRECRLRYACYSLVMGTIVNDIDMLREDMRVRNPPYAAALPTPMLLQTTLLPSPCYNPLVPDAASVFTARVLDVIRHCPPNVTVFEAYYLDRVTEDSVPAILALPLAWMIGQSMDITEVDVVSSLRARVVGKLLTKVDRLSVLVNPLVGAMLTVWKVSANAYVARMASEIDG